MFNRPLSGRWTPHGSPHQFVSKCSATPATSLTSPAAPAWASEPEPLTCEPSGSAPRQSWRRWQEESPKSAPSARTSGRPPVGLCTTSPPRPRETKLRCCSSRGPPRRPATPLGDNWRGTPPKLSAKRWRLALVGTPSPATPVPTALSSAPRRRPETGSGFLPSAHRPRSCPTAFRCTPRRCVSACEARQEELRPTSDAGAATCPVLSTAEPLSRRPALNDPTRTKSARSSILPCGSRKRSARLRTWRQEALWSQLPARRASPLAQIWRAVIEECENQRMGVSALVRRVSRSISDSVANQCVVKMAASRRFVQTKGS